MSSPAPADAPPSATPPPPPGTPPPAAAPPASAPLPTPQPTAEDPHAIGGALGRLGILTRRSARSAAHITSALLDDGEVVECLVQGKYLGQTCVGVLTDRRFVVVNDREWKPDIRPVDLGPGVTVQGFGDDRTASLTFSGQGEPLTIEAIGDTGLAREMAQRVRGRTGQA